jgi:putative transposase
MIMQNSNSLQQQSQEILGRILEGKNPDIQSFLINGMSDLLNQAFVSERQFYLDDNNGDKANGFSPVRKVGFGTNQIPISVPRSRSGDFYPSLLPKYGRNVGLEYLNILEEIILNCKSFRSISDTVRGLGLTYSPKQLETFLADLFEESKRFNARQLDADLAFLYIDAKVIDLADEGGAIKKAVHFTALGVNMECKKELLLSISFFGSESLDLWKKVIMNLKNRGLTRVLMLITDDFSGLNKMASGLLPSCDHQLCLVHLMRNLKKNLSQKLYEDFGLLLQEIYLAGSFEAASIKLSSFIENNIKPESSSYAKYLKERLENYLVFTKYPAQLRPVIRSTNAVEGINNAIEIARRNSGGYFHSEREMAVKMKIIFDNLAGGKWRNPIPRYAGNLTQINQIFCERFEG